MAIDKNELWKNIMSIDDGYCEAGAYRSVHGDDLVAPMRAKPEKDKACLARRAATMLKGLARFVSKKSGD
jgi:hypothetical protein